jgi:Na+/proline symporter
LQGIWNGVEESRWRIADPQTFGLDVLEALSALAIGSLGNLPMQDLMQRVFSARSEKVASRACYLASGGYLIMGGLPVGTGLAASLLLPGEGSGEAEVVMRIASELLNPWLLLLFFLAVVSAVLSTIVSAVMAPAAVLSHNLVQPGWERLRGRRLSERQALMMQRGAILVIAGASMWLATGGSTAYELVLDSYAMGLVGLFIPFIAGLRFSQVPHFAAVVSMLSGILVWGFHLVMGWELTLQPWLNQRFPLPQELAATGISGIGLGFGWFLARRFGIREPEEEEMGLIGESP